VTLPEVPMSPVAELVMVNVDALNATVPVAVTAAAFTLILEPVSVALPAPEIVPFTLIVAELSVSWNVLPVAADDAFNVIVAAESVNVTFKFETDITVVAFVVTLPDVPMSPVAESEIDNIAAFNATAPVADTAAAFTFILEPVNVVLPAPDIVP